MDVCECVYHKCAYMYTSKHRGVDQITTIKSQFSLPTVGSGYWCTDC